MTSFTPAPLPPGQPGQPLRRIVVVGGGTAGWMTAAPLAQLFNRDGGRPCEVVLVESPDIGTIGVGEATLPTIRYYNRALGLDGADFIRRTQATFKLGIEFRDWGAVGHRFFHGFGGFGPAIENVSPHHHWLRLAGEAAESDAAGQAWPPLEDWSAASVMARGHKFTPPQGDTPAAANAFSYAFHFDAGLYAAYLRDYAIERGAQRVSGTITRVLQHAESGEVTALELADGRRIDGDLFVDCSGLRALLIEGTLQAGFDDWSAWLPCDSALAVPSERTAALTPYTTSTAGEAGWRWRIPLQHRTGNGHVYASGFTSDDEAARALLAGLDGAPLESPRPIRFTTGCRRAHWVKNVVAVGLAGGFLEPLESTSIQLIMDAVGRLIELMPTQGGDAALAAEFNRRMRRQYESVRDFIVLHYTLTQRQDSAFWRYCAAMPIPDTLQHQIELFKATARVAILDPDGFAEPSWVSLLLGLGVQPRGHDPRADLIPAAALRGHFERVRTAIARTAADMPTQAEFIARHVAAPPVPASAPAGRAPAAASPPAHTQPA